MALGEVPIKGNARFAETPVLDVVKQYDALYIGVSGDVTVDLPGDSTSDEGIVSANITFKNVPVGFFPVTVRKIYTAGTTATSILGLNW